MIYERESCTVRHITAAHYFLNPVSATFHGRDIFAPTAALAFQDAGDRSLRRRNHRLCAVHHAQAPSPTETPSRASCLRVDAFGNLMTNLTAEDIPSEPRQRSHQTRRQWQASGEVRRSVCRREPGRTRRRDGLGRVPRNCGESRQCRALLGANRGAEVILTSVSSL